MALEVEAIYEDGRFLPLSPVHLQNGEKVKLDITVQSARERMRETLVGLLVEDEDDGEDLGDVPPVGVFDVYASQGKPLSQLIIEEREESP